MPRRLACRRHALQRVEQRRWLRSPAYSFGMSRQLVCRRHALQRVEQRRWLRSPAYSCLGSLID